MNSFVCHYLTSGKPTEKLLSANPKHQDRNVLFVVRRHIAYLKQRIAKMKLLPHSTAHEYFFVVLKPLVVVFRVYFESSEKKNQVELIYFDILWLSLR